MVYCSVRGCKTSQKNAKEKGIKLFSFPKDPSAVQKWIDVCQKQRPVNTKTARICSIHFKEDSFEKPAIQIALGYSPKRFRKLKATAVPTEFLQTDDFSDSTEMYDNRLQESEDPFTKDRLQESEDPLPEVQESEDPFPECFQETEVERTQRESQTIQTVVARDISAENEILSAEVSRLRYKLNQSKENIEDLTKQVTELQAEIIYYKNIVEKRQELSSLNSTLIFEKKVKDLLSPMFTNGQIDMILSGNKRVAKSSKEDIAAAISLRSVSNKAYRYLRVKMHFPVPCLSTLKEYASKFQVKQGLQEDTLLLMKRKGISLTCRERATALSFDEMYISPVISFDKATEQVIGPHRRVQVGMARGLVSNWKQPVFYSYDFNMTEEALSSIISSLHDSSYDVVSVTSDMGSSNQALWKSLDVSDSKSSFPHPVTKDNIFVFADAPHLLKLARDHLLDSGFVLGNGSFVGKGILQLLVNLNLKDLKVSFKISQFHLDVSGSQRQKVKWAAQIFSHTTASAIKFCGENGMLQNYKWQDAFRIIKLFNDWYDVLNSCAKFDKCAGRHAYGVNLEVQRGILDEMDEFIKTMRVHGKRNLLPFQKGILVTNRSLKSVFDHLHQKYNLEYILTRRLNQDCLENFFSFIRGMGGSNDHPTPLSFQYRLRWYTLGKHPDAVLSRNKNTEEVSSDALLVDFLDDESTVMTYDVLKKSNALTDNPVDESSEIEEAITLESIEGVVANIEVTEEDINVLRMFELQIAANNCNLDKIEEQALRFVAGYVARRFSKEFPGLSGGLAKVSDIEKCEDCDWISCISKDHLTLPSTEFENVAKLMEVEFKSFHGFSAINHEPGAVRKVVNKIKDKVPSGLLSENVLHCLVRTRLFFRIRQMNREIHSKLLSRKRSLQLKRKFQK